MKVESRRLLIIKVLIMSINIAIVERGSMVNIFVAGKLFALIGLEMRLDGGSIAEILIAMIHWFRSGANHRRHVIFNLNARMPVYFEESSLNYGTRPALSSGTI